MFVEIDSGVRVEVGVADAQFGVSVLVGPSVSQKHEPKSERQWPLMPPNTHEPTHEKSHGNSVGVGLGGQMASCVGVAVLVAVGLAVGTGVEVVVGADVGVGVSCLPSLKPQASTTRAMEMASDSVCQLGRIIERSDHGHVHFSSRSVTTITSATLHWEGGARRCCPR